MKKTTSERTKSNFSKKEKWEATVHVFILVPVPPFPNSRPTAEVRVTGKRDCRHEPVIPVLTVLGTSCLDTRQVDKIHRQCALAVAVRSENENLASS